jgi:flavin reductase (DIM6/NTAB) family NADH-FMN oxidoreductase RutF
MMQSQVAEVIKRFMRAYPQGVCIATTTYDNKPWGLTVSSFTSISLDPPLIMVSIGKGTKSHDAFIGSDNLAVNLLSAGQEVLADAFAGKVPQERRFDLVEYRIGKSGAPILNAASGYLDCKKWRVYEAGDHSIILGEVIDGDVSGIPYPLVYHNRKYTTVATAYVESVFAPDFW